jgi:hypothetical protein
MQAYHLWFKHLHLTCISLSRFFYSAGNEEYHPS